MTTVAEVLETLGTTPAETAELVATGGPADVTFRAGARVRGFRVEGYTTLLEPGVDEWEIEVVGEPIQLGARVRGVGVVWAPV